MGTTTKKLGNKKLSEQIYDLLRKDIVECRLEPGDLLEEGLVTKRYQIGRTPYREACHWLEAEGLIEIVPHRGCFVASFSTKDINDLFDLRLILEPRVAEIASQRSNSVDLAPLERVINEAERLAKSKLLNTNPKLNWNSMNFHVEVARLTMNKEIESTVEDIQTKLMRIVMFTARRSPENYPFNAIHPEIYEAIRNRRRREAREAMIRDIVTARKWIREFGQ